MSWRDTIRVHPAADLFPMMSDEELVALGEDIKGGLINPIAIQVNDDGVPLLIDGSNRLDAMERIGWRVQIKKGEGRGHRSRSWYLLVEDDDGSSCPAFNYPQFFISERRPKRCR